mgnify:FL=1
MARNHVDPHSSTRPAHSAPACASGADYPVAPRGHEDLRRLVKRLAVEGEVFRGRYFWHQTSDPYMLFLAEFFLRRSNRTTVARYLPSFLEHFPTAEALVRADVSAVLEAASWAGLRARTASLPEVLAQFMERTHWSARELMSLPHIGEYAAKGIALYIFAEPVFPIDNNVLRVVGRYLGVAGRENIARTVEELTNITVNEGGMAALRLAHMGALAIGWEYCRAKNPRCEACPLSESCVAWPEDRRSAVVSYVGGAEQGLQYRI